jgi:hypothetical protein
MPVWSHVNETYIYDAKPGSVVQVLVLSETVMLKWREDVLSKIGHLTGDRLELRSGGIQAQQQFAFQVLPQSVLYRPIPVCMTLRLRHQEPGPGTNAVTLEQVHHHVIPFHLALWIVKPFTVPGRNAPPTTIGCVALRSACILQSWSA